MEAAIHAYATEVSIAESVRRCHLYFVSSELGVMAVRRVCYERAAADAQRSTMFLEMRGVPYLGVADACRLAPQIASRRFG